MSAQTKGMVLFTDGGARPNPGFGGIGIHGYTYVPTPMTKGIGRNFHITSQGYIDKAGADDLMHVPKNDDDIAALLNDGKAIAVTPINYVDITGSVEGVSSNNMCEIIAMTKALSYAVKHDIAYLTVFADSEYTLKGVTEWIDSWSNNNWMKSDGNPVANKDLWLALKEARDEIRAKGVVVNFTHISAHAGEVGNERADMLASMGVFDGHRGIIGDTVEESTPDDYWKSNHQRHPFVSYKRCYFSSQAPHLPGVYHLGNQTKDEELLGKRVGDGCFSVVKLQEPDQVVEMIRKHQSGLSGMSDSVFSIFLDQVYNADLYKATTVFGERSIEPPKGYRLDLKHATKTWLTREFKPVGLARRAIDELVNLESILDQYVQGGQNITKTDITHYFYDLVEKKIPPKKGQSEGTVEVSTKLKPEIIVGLASMKVQAALPFEVPGNEGPITDEITLAMGIDVLERNSLKRLETMNPKVYLVTWSVSDLAYRYATIIEAEGSVGIWCGVYSNVKLLVKKT